MMMMMMLQKRRVGDSRLKLLQSFVKWRDGRSAAVRNYTLVTL